MYSITVHVTNLYPNRLFRPDSKVNCSPNSKAPDNMYMKKIPIYISYHQLAET